VKKNIRTILLLILCISLLVSCSSKSDDSSQKESGSIDGQLTIFGGSVGGVWSVFTEGVSEAVRREHQGANVSAVPGTVAGNVVAVSEGKADFAISESLTAKFALDGTVNFDETHENIRAVAGIMPINVFQLVAPKSVSFSSVEEVATKDLPMRYSAGEKNALGDVISESVFEAYDLSYELIEQNGGEVNFLSGPKTFELMSDARIDSLGKMVPIPASDILEASATIDMKLIPIGDQAIDYLVEEYGVMPYTMEAGSYDFQEEDYETVNTPTILITSEEIDEETVYNVTKAIYNQLDYLADVHNGFKEVNDETITEVGTIPLHPGAERFFKEEGLLE